MTLLQKARSMFSTTTDEEIMTTPISPKETDRFIGAFTESIDIFLGLATDEEVLTAFNRFGRRVSLTNRLIQDDDGEVRSQSLIVIAGNHKYETTPVATEWPMVPREYPETLKGTLN